MPDMGSVVATFDSQADAEGAIRALQKSGFDMKLLSLIGRDLHAEQHVAGYYNAGERMMCWGKSGAFWGGIWGLLFGSAVFLVPGVGPLMVAGPFVTAMVGALEGAVLVGGLSALGGAMYGLGIPRDTVLLYENEIRYGRLILIVRSNAHDSIRARALLNVQRPTTVRVHSPATEPALITSL